MNETSALFHELFSFGEEEKGFTEQEIVEAEERLGIRLPEDLRVFYLTQVKNTLINSCHYFAPPHQLYIDQSDFLVFYGENQGIWAIAYNLKDDHIYINFEQMGYEKEAENLKDFFIIRAACDYGQYIYPIRLFADHISAKDLELLKQNLPSLKSKITPPHYYHKSIFWDNEDEVVQIIQYAPQNWNGKILVYVLSRKKDTIDKIKQLDINWNHIKEYKIDRTAGLQSYL